MDEDVSSHDSVEDDVLRQKEFRRGSGIDLGQFMIQEPDENLDEEQIVIEKKTDELNILLAEIDPSIQMAKVYYFKELNCNSVDLSWDYERIIKNFKILSVIIYQEFTTDIRGNPN